jgi:hypothetical protein
MLQGGKDQACKGKDGAASSSQNAFAGGLCVLAGWLVGLLVFFFFFCCFIILYTIN